MKFGIKTISRNHARNYNYESSQKRLDETVTAFNSQVLNALNVDYVPVHYYNIMKTGINCTCEKHSEVITTDRHSNPNTGSNSDETWAEVHDYEVVDASSYNSMFGDNSNFDSSDDDGEEFEPQLDNIENYTSADSLFAGSNNNCGICYRTGFLPGFSLQRGTRLVLTTYDIAHSVGYSIDSGEQPYIINKLIPDGYVEYDIAVPKYYCKAKFSIRNNTEICHDTLFTNLNTVLSNSIIKAHCGKTLTIRCRASNFSHIVIEFFFDADEIRANIPNTSKTLDYTMLETVGNLQVILPMTIGNITAGDHLAIPSRNLYLKAVDIENYSTSTMRRLEWRVTCRVLQPQEALKRLSFGYFFI